MSDEVVYLDGDEEKRRRLLGPIAERIAAMIDQENAMKKLMEPEKVRAREALAKEMQVSLFSLITVQ